MDSPTGRQTTPPEYHYLGRVGRQDHDDTLANSAELLTFDYGKIERRLLKQQLGWRYFFRWLIPSARFFKMLYGGNNATVERGRSHQTHGR